VVLEILKQSKHKTTVTGKAEADTKWINNTHDAEINTDNITQCTLAMKGISFVKNLKFD
jgi:hypothetical protein